MDNLHKVLQCVKAFYSVVNNEQTVAQASFEIQKTLGSSYSFVSAAQFLTGKKAEDVFHQLPNNYSENGIDKAIIGATILMANEFCANASKNGSISNGKNVKFFLDDSGLTIEEKAAKLVKFRV